MSTPTQLIAKARRQTYSNSTSYTDTDASLDLNNRLAILYSRVQTEVDEGHFWTWATSATVANQSEYTIATIGTNPINQIDGVSVMYHTTDTTYTKLNPVAYESLEYDMASYSDWAGEPFYFVKDQSVFIFPTPTVAVTSGIKIFSVNQPLDVTTSSAEADIKIAPRFHQYAVWGMCADYWFSNGREDKGNLWEQKFTQGGDAMVKAMKHREKEPLEHIVSLNPFE